MISEMTVAVTVLCIVAVVYHHLLYPLLLRLLSAGRRREFVLPIRRAYRPGAWDRRLPTMHIIMPAHNEERFIAEKIRNLAMLDYPADKLKVSVLCDGCDDATADIARETAKELSCEHLQLDVIVHATNRGKVAVLNEAVSASTAVIVGLSDVSALISADALLVAAAHFERKRVGVVSSSYQLWREGNAGEQAYWRYQTRIKSAESALGSTLGAHGAFYCFRRVLFTPLAADTINDDFVLPMAIVNRGYRCVYEPRITALELERAGSAVDYRRRVRIAAGNMQQAWRLLGDLHVRNLGVVFNFLSGKLLRVAMPPLMIAALLGSAWLAAQGDALFAAAFMVQLAGYALAASPMVNPRWGELGLIRALHYLVAGHIANLQGSLAYLLGHHRGHWQRAHSAMRSANVFVHPCARCGKRCCDVAGSMLALLLTLPLFPLLALLIKLDSPGPVLFRQVRIGRAWPERVELFTMLKFRSMRADAEVKSGPQWARKSDPRTTRVGAWMRKTRLDELPQLFNVLMGDMSLIGPRPERPGFYAKLEQEIPFYVERTYGVAPGITGLAQVNQGYDENLDDVRRKLAFDHAYALALSRPMSWLRADAGIACKTVAVMLLGRGQ
jgi:lipopolysaccharide/colanic/teichoic acid biosynthesis glycosyltransferase